ncbi:hypothetical protein RvY_08674 [Ramazzottius varieornatus]|uniref:Uncharacterized protein n=1 Tax=Ramazzottius varieornatus TaxID=947166 RepID=A0A1D1V8Y1_RAMVA|nr:hypothetical protein RvY_08674 [Ramazzottius varieornatus]
MQEEDTPLEKRRLLHELTYCTPAVDARILEVYGRFTQSVHQNSIKQLVLSRVYDYGDRCCSYYRQ